MFFRRNENLDTSLFDPDHDMDLVMMVNNARTEQEMQAVARISRARMHARRTRIRAGKSPRRRNSSV
ncbi:MAG TPA: hypothetical protein VMV16_05070 [Solirubrobacteraceae bacterium]|nr:hypothetical protein [Solirubrobacteraceae bacterium]